MDHEIRHYDLSEIENIPTDKLIKIRDVQRSYASQCYQEFSEARSTETLIKMELERRLTKN